MRTRFKPGQSGNPAGRPRGSRNRAPAREVQRANEIALAAAYREIPVVDGGQVSSVPMLAAVWRTLMTKAAKGDSRSIEYVIDRIGEIERQRETDLANYLRTVIAYQEETYAEIERCEAAGEVAREYYPHPDDIRIDFGGGTVDIIGPSEPEDRELWDKIDAALLAGAGTAAEIERLEVELEDGDESPVARRRLHERLTLVRRLSKAVETLTAGMSPADKAWRLRRLAAKTGGGRG